MILAQPLWLAFALPGLALMIWAQARMLATFARYSGVPNGHGLSGLEAARYLLQQCGLGDVRVESVTGHLADHYDPVHKVLRLSPAVGARDSLASLGVVAHEVGHAIQDAHGYLPLRLRTTLVPMTLAASRLGWALLAAGLLLRLAGLVSLALLLLSVAVAFALVTLPVEWDASRRALALLRRSGLASKPEERGMRAVLGAAAFTYVAALLLAVGQLAYWVIMAGKSARRG